MARIEKVLVVGDSITRGVVYDEDKGRYIFLKECFVNLVSKKLSCDVKNVSKYGATVEHGIVTLDKYLAEYQPDVVLIEFGGNDSDYDWTDVEKNPEIDHQPRVLFERYIEVISDMVNEIRSAGKLSVLCTPPPVDDARYFEWFTKGDEKAKNNVLKWLKNVSRIHWQQEKYSAGVSALAEKLGTHLIDIRREILTKSQIFSELMCRDGIHPNIKGHAVIAECITRFVKANSPELLLGAAK